MIFAALVSSLALAIGLAIYDLAVRQLNLSTLATQSQIAIYAADAGLECALYWDSVAGMNVFATSSTSVAPAGEFTCAGQDVYNSTAGLSWVTQTSGSSATTTFSFSSPSPACATVVVSKTVDVSGILYTTVVSHGYNRGYVATVGTTPATCAGTLPNKLERVIQANY